tara:strand:+ start:33459 stop:33647 length:189 start_codon:yes stop_codon:yes gene_type:complete
MDKKPKQQKHKGDDDAAQRSASGDPRDPSSPTCYMREFPEYFNAGERVPKTKPDKDETKTPR